MTFWSSFKTKFYKQLFKKETSFILFQDLKISVDHLDWFLGRNIRQLFERICWLQRGSK